MKKALLALVVLGAVAAAGYAYYNYRDQAPKFTVTTAAVTRGDVVDTVGATGTLQAVTTVQVGTQVSGTILSLYADFNSLVKKGQVLARLDPSLFQTQIEQARANLLRSQADLERLKVGVDDAQTKVSRARELSERLLLPKSDLDTAEVNLRSAQAQLRSAEAQVTQAQASLNQNDVNMAHTVIEAPIDGLVISRNVDVGQTVAASMQAPTLFVLAADLTKMQVVANLDESDVGRIRPGQIVTFRVDAYPTETFTGTLSQVRLEPKVQQNVVTYATVIDVPNNQLKLKPGMTANVNIEIARASNVLRLPNSALRFRPTNEMYAAIGQPAPDPAARGDLAAGGGSRRGGPPDAGLGAAPAPADAAAQSSPSATPSTAVAPARGARATADTAGGGRQGAAPEVARVEGGPVESGPSGGRGGFTRGGGGRGGASGSTGSSGASGRAAASGGRGGGDGTGGGDRLAGRLDSLTPEQREQRLQRIRGRGGDPSARSTDAGAARGAAPAPAAPAPARASGATTIDALFGPLPRTQGVGRVWVYVDKQLKPLRVRTGISDGQATELLDGDIQPGAELVTNIATGTAAARPAAQAFPFGGQPGRGGFAGGGGFGGGGNRGGGGGR